MLAAFGLSLVLPTLLPDVHGPPLYDVIHDNVPPIHVYVPDALLAAIAGYVYMWSKVDAVPSQAIVICFVIRAVTCSVTRLPTPLPAGHRGSKHDLMFSGHTVLFMALADALEGPLATIVRWIFPATCVLSRQHYTSDVIVAMVLFACINAAH